MSIEEHIKCLASDFKNYYKNYRIEEDIRSKLAEYLRGEFPRTDNNDDKVRTQFPIWDERKKHFDIAILTEKAASEFAEHYGDIKKGTENFHSHAIFELKQITEPSDKEEKIKDAIERLIKVIKQKRTQNAYMLIFSHYNKDTLFNKNELSNRYLKYTNKFPNLYIYCIFSERPKYACLNSGKITWKSC